VIAATVGAIIGRTGVMAVQNYYTLSLMTALSQTYIISIMPIIALFNVTEPLYVIPISYFLARAISSNLKLGNRLESTVKQQSQTTD
jgi:hypothetical protein